MDFKLLIKKYINRACIYFTFIAAAYMLLMVFINQSDDSPAIEAYRLLLIFIFSFLFAFADAVRSIKQIPSTLGRIIHFVIVIFACYACFMTEMLPKTVLTGLIIISFIYWISLGIKSFFSSRLKKNREASQSYQKQFKNK
jgi:glucan phosphoethanolaminetransferase (alkaline phosphatase superfamily)